MKSIPVTGGAVNEDPLKCAQLRSCSCRDFEAMGLDQALRQLGKTSLTPESRSLLLHSLLSIQNSRKDFAS